MQTYWKIGDIASIFCEVLFMQSFYIFILLETLVISHEGLVMVYLSFG